MTGSNRPAKISHFIRLRQLRVKLISRVVEESRDSLFPSERLSLQYSEMLSISSCFHCLSPDMICTAFSNGNLHETSTQRAGNFIPILKITRDELPMEQGVYGDTFAVPFILS